MGPKKQGRRAFLGAVAKGVAASTVGGLRGSKGAIPPQTDKPGRANPEDVGGLAPVLEKAAPISMAERAKRKSEVVRAGGVSDYVFGKYQGDFACPPHADFNPKQAIIVVWEGKPYTS